MNPREGDDVLHTNATDDGEPHTFLSRECASCGHTGFAERAAYSETGAFYAKVVCTRCGREREHDKQDEGM